MSRIKRWDGSNLESSKKEINTCLDTIDPNHILIISESAHTSDKKERIWVNEIKQEISKRGIMHTVMEVK